MKKNETNSSNQEQINSSNQASSITTFAPIVCISSDNFLKNNDVFSI
jgi:hypothetical protein